MRREFFELTNRDLTDAAHWGPPLQEQLPTEALGQSALGTGGTRQGRNLIGDELPIILALVPPRLLLAICAAGTQLLWKTLKQKHHLALLRGVDLIVRRVPPSQVGVHIYLPG